MQSTNRLLIKRLIQLLAAIITLLVLLAVFNYFTSGRIIISVQGDGANDTVAVFKLGTNTTNSKAVKQAAGRLDTRLKPGSYIATVSGKSFSTERVVAVTARKTSSYVLTAASLSEPEPVLSGDAGSLAADATQLLYVNPGLRSLFRVDSQNNISRLDKAPGLQQVKWAGAGFGVGQDELGALYTVTNGVVAGLSPPAGAQQNNAIERYAVSKDQTVYAVAGKTIYSHKAGGSWQRLFDADLPVGLLAVSDNMIAFSNASADEGSESQPGLTVADASGVRGKKDITVDDLAWSPNGNYLAVGSPAYGFVFDSSLRQVAVMPAAGATNLRWLGNDVLLYSVKNQLWRYNLKEQQASKLMDSPTDGVISDLSLSADGAYAYIAFSNNAGSSIKRLGLQGQKTSQDIYKLAVFLPVKLDQCRAQLVNFTAPSVLVTPYDSSLTDICLLNIRANLQDDQIDIGALHFVVQDQRSIDGD